LAYRIGVSWIDRRLRAIGLRPYTCRRMDWGESIVGVRSLNAVEAINDYLHFNLFVVRASTMPSASLPMTSLPLGDARMRLRRAFTVTKTTSTKPLASAL